MGHREGPFLLRFELFSVACLSRKQIALALGVPARQGSVSATTNGGDQVPLHQYVGYFKRSPYWSWYLAGLRP